MNQAIADVIENQLEEDHELDFIYEQDQNNQLEPSHDNDNVDNNEVDNNNQFNMNQFEKENLFLKGVRHYSIEEQHQQKQYLNQKPKGKQTKAKYQLYYSPEIKKQNSINRVYLSPLNNYSKFATPNTNLRQGWSNCNNNNSNVINNHNEHNQYGSPINYSFWPLIYQYPQIYDSPQNYYSNSYMNNNPDVNDFFSMNHNNPQNQFNDDMILHKIMNSQIKSVANNKKIKKKKGKAYISQSPTLKSLFANLATTDQGIKVYEKNKENNMYQKEEKNQINLEPIIKGIDKRTSLMIKNIPNKYTIATFLEEINADFKTKYDIFYLPIDYENKCNLGFAFINFVDPLHIIDFYDTYKGKKWRRFNSEKICDLVYAKIQGKEELIAHFEKGKVLSFESEDKRPLILPTPSPLPLVTLSGKYINKFMMAYPFATYHSISNDKYAIESLITF